ncbi:MULTISPECIES: amidohydrolase family protein [unclassified Pseudoalteromonas]|uniref:amidohydrolase family protein n=1 Tax=unclassified Pseudoalteromonas TaxID=194690 RepID=UPI0018CDE70D|nr:MULTISPECIES: amidohydrolase family protein [unclassified Pseudoalteromonas]MBH0012931.1 amidohydrolase family protein [Pseudoalteromonas sp. NZS100_1]MBH0042579.1 amidohydrolase family protein [Pseudoalteromonas sp. SWXJZ10B]MBH0050189.1 amidohydrolase family protein [Pseudoalteromonas sp. SWYJZ19]
MSLKIIDPHVHFFNLVEGQYSWLQGANPPAWPNLEKIKQPVSAQQLVKSTDFELVGLVHIEAGFDNTSPINELNWLDSHLKGIPFKAISYNQIDSSADEFINSLEALAHLSLCGIRDITEGTDAKRLLDANSFKNLTTLSDTRLHFEAQFDIENSEITKQIAYYAKQLPQLQIIINHAGLPSNLNDWRQGVELLAQHDNIAIKFSGFELLQLTSEQQAACFNFLFNHFGQQRIMFASNFPVCQINTSYNTLWHCHKALCSNDKTWHDLSYTNAKHYYQV